MANGGHADDEPHGPADESPFARGLDGYLIRADEPTAEALRRPVVGLVIDGRPVEELLPDGPPVMEAVAETDELGQPVHRDGRLVRRATTIYDVLARIAAARQEPNPAPVLCHQTHLRPVAACRLCSVVVERKPAPGRQERPPAKLFPACQHVVADGMKVHTAKSDVMIDWVSEGHLRRAGDVVGGVVRTLAELLVTDHLPAYTPGRANPDHELWTVARQFAVPARGRFPLPLAAAKARPAAPGRPAGPLDDTSSFIRVDHAACILCDRCSRGCTDVRHNDVIGRTGKGYFTRIGFDLDVDMGASVRDESCVTCGECAVWCPTDALTIKAPHPIPPDPKVGGRLAGTATVGRLAERPLGPLSVAELRAHPLFGRLPAKLFDWVQGSVVRRALGVRRDGKEWKRDVLVRENEYGSSAFLLESGTLRLGIEAPLGGVELVPGKRRWWTLGRGRSAAQWVPAAPAAAGGGRAVTVRTDAGSTLTGGHTTQWLTFNPQHPYRFVGESACLSNGRYGSTVVAAEPSVVLEVRKNVLLALLRHPDTRAHINASLRATTLADLLQRLAVLQRFAPGRRSALAAGLAAGAEFLRVPPGREIYRQGEAIDRCAFVRVGFVRLTRREAGVERHDYVGPGGVIGPDALAAAGGGAAAHTHTAAALDNVELIEFPAAGLRDAIAQAPQPVPPAAPPAPAPPAPVRAVAPPPNPGYFAEKLLVLDLTKCTRCDECTKACADTHADGETRLIREGLREGNFLVATSCRSCLDPRCMVGCPVDAIHRFGDHPEVVIDNHCIGCGLCEANCPYGNIRMIPVPGGSYPRRAITCDLCRNLVGENEDPSCVYACPHDAAHRVTGSRLLEMVAEQREPRGTP